MSVSTTYVGTAIAASATTTATVTLGSLIGIDALTVLFGLFGGFVALAFPLNKDDELRKHYFITFMQVMAAGMVAAALTEIGLTYMLTYTSVTLEGAAKALAFLLGYLAKWALPSAGAVVVASTKNVLEVLSLFVSRRK